MSDVSKGRMGDEPPYPKAGYAWYVVAILCVAYTLSFIDRQILAFLVGPIQSDFGIDDFEFGLLHGLAFALFYTVMGIPLGRMADGGSRRGLIGVGIAVWSAMTFLCGIAQNFWQLFLARIGVGVGEAALSPAAYSILADYFPKEKRSLPISVFSSGVIFGAAFANVFGGLLVAFAMSGGAEGIPFFGSLRPWQLPLVLVGLPGILFALMMFTVKEPVRREAAGGADIKATARYMRSHWFTYLTLILGAAFSATVNYSFMTWVPTWFSRIYGWSQAETGPWFGLAIFIGGLSGLITAGVLAERMLAAGKTAVYSKLMLTTQILVLAPLLMSLVFDNPYLVMACIGLVGFCLSFPLGLTPTALQAVTPNEMRGQVTAVYLFVLSLIALGIGPSTVGWLTTYFFADVMAVGRSAVTVGVCSASLSVVLLASGLRAYARMAAGREGRVAG